MRETQVLVIGGSLIGLTSIIVAVEPRRRAHPGRPSTAHERSPAGSAVRPSHTRAAASIRCHKDVEATGIGDLWTRQNRWIESLSGKNIAAVPSESFQMAPADYSPSIPVMGAQDMIEATLLAKARESEIADVRFYTSAEELTQDADGCSATLIDRESGEGEAIRSQYIVAADGVSQRHSRPDRLSAR